MDKIKKKEKRDRQKSDRIKLPTNTNQKGSLSLMNSITQDMKFRQSLMNYAKKYGVSRASRKYNKSRSYIYSWLKRWDGSVESLAVKSRRPHHHPNEHTKEEIDLIKRYHKRNPTLELPELWHRLRKQGYTRCLESLYRVMKKLGMLPIKSSASYFDVQLASVSVKMTTAKSIKTCLFINSTTP